MRSSIHWRRTRANDLRVFVRDDVPGSPASPDSPNQPDQSDSEDEGEPDTPSPTTDVFPPPTTTSSSAEQPGGISSTTANPASQPTVIAPSTSEASTESSTELPAQLSTQLPTESPSQSTLPDTGLAQTGVPQNNDALPAQASQVGGTPSMSRDATIAVGVVGSVVAIAAIIFFVWICRRRRNRAGDGDRGLFSGFRKMEEPQEPVWTNDGLAGKTQGKTQSKIMDDLMAAAYAAEDGNASQFGGYTDEKHHSQAPQMRQLTKPDPRDARSSGGSNTLYVNQILSGFYKAPRADGLAAPPNARMPPPAAPSVAAQTETTNTTESTWRTWGWSQKKPPKETWVDRCIRLGGLK